MIIPERMLLKEEEEVKRPCLSPRYALWITAVVSSREDDQGSHSGATLLANPSLGGCKLPTRKLTRLSFLLVVSDSLDIESLGGICLLTASHGHRT